MQADPLNAKAWAADQVLAFVLHMNTERDKRWSEVILRLDQLMKEKDLRDQQRFDAQQKALTDALQSAEKAVTAALTAAQTAVQKAEVANEKRLDGVNEFRRTVEDLTKYLMTKAEAVPQFDAIREKLGELTDRFNKREGLGMGQVAEQIERRTSSTFMVQVMVAIIAAASLAVVIIELTRSVPHP